MSRKLALVLVAVTATHGDFLAAKEPYVRAVFGGRGEGHAADVGCVRFSPDGNVLVSARADKTIKLWDIPGNKLLASLAGHSSEVTSIAFSPSGKTLASASYDKTVKLWDFAPYVPNRSANGVQANVPIATQRAPDVATTPAQPEGWATIRGTFKLNGAAPPRRPLVVDRDRNVCASDDKLLLSEDLVVESKTNGINDVVLFLASPEKFPVGDPKWEHPDYLGEADATREFEIKSCVFTSHTFVLRTSQKLNIVNRDPIAHFVRLTAGNDGRVLTSIALPANASELYQPTSEDSQPSRVSNSIHPWMSAQILVRDNPYFAVTKPDGSFEIRNLPAGVLLEFRVWQEKAGFLQNVKLDGNAEVWPDGRFRRTLTPDATLTLNVTVDATVFVKPEPTTQPAVPPSAPNIAQKSAAPAQSDPTLIRRPTLAEEMQRRADESRALLAEYNRLLAEAEKSGGKIDPVFAELVKSAPSLTAAAQAAHRSQSANNLKLLAIALHSHYKPLSQPVAFRLNREGQPLLSWRVGLLPHLEQQALYDEFHLDEPWDSEHNKKLIARMPPVFRAPTSTAPAGMTTYLGVGGPHGVIAAPRGRSRLESWDNDVPARGAVIPDGPSNTLAIVEASDALAIEWTKPEEWVPNDKEPIEGLVPPQAQGFLAAFVDGHTDYFYKQTPAETLRRVFSRDDGQNINGWGLNDLMRASAPRAGSIGPPSSPKNLLQLLDAMHQFYDRYGTFPPAFVASKEGQPLLSWRVGLLPFLDEKSLYAEFHLNEAWDSEHNKKLIARMPKVFETPGTRAATGTTRYLGVGGKWGVVTRPAIDVTDIRDGSANQLAVVEAKEDAAVVWSRPEEWVPDEKDPFLGLLGPQSDGFFAALANGQIVRIPKNYSPEMLRRMFIRSDGQLTDVPAPIPKP